MGNLHMFKFHEDAYWPENLSLFTISCEHYWGPKKQNHEEIWHKNLSLFAISGKHYIGPKKQNFEEIWHPQFCPMLGQYFRTLFVLQGVRKNAKSDIFWSHSYSKIHLSKQHFCHKKRGLKKQFFLTRNKTKNVL